MARIAQLRFSVVRLALAPAALVGAALAAILVGAGSASAQGPNDHDLPVLPDPPVLAMRGSGETLADSDQLLPSDGTAGALTADGQLTVGDDDGLFELRAHLIGQDGADPTIHVHDQSGALVYEYNLLLTCPHADTCRVVSDVFVEFEAGGSWLVDLNHGSGKLREWQLEVYREGTTLGNIDMPPFSAPPVVAARGDGSLLPDGRHLIPMTLSEGAATNDQGALLFSDDDGVFGLRAYFVAPNGAEATARVYPGDGGQPLYEYQMIVACPTQPLCRVATNLALHLGSGGTWSIALEHVDGRIYDWQLEIYRDEPAGLPTTGTGGLLDGGVGAREVGLVLLAMLGVSGLGVLSLLARRRGRSL